ncbi:MAG TPA: hypothetical protein VK137_01090, partial [Planctomycetaceae bacterium]|nr:hypothetical protein [Planctomycetaceae bacterium]
QTHLNPKAKPISLKVPTGPKTLAAEVLTETTKIRWNNVDQECQIIECRGENETFRTYVRKSDGQVLRQESQAPGGRFVIQRQ